MRTFFEKFVHACPHAPYLAAGLWMAWLRITYDAAIWISEPDYAGITSAQLYIRSTAALGVTLLLCALFAKRLQPLALRRGFPVLSGAVATLGALTVIAVGPSFLQFVAPAAVWRSAFIAGAYLTGVGMAGILVCVGAMFGTLLPRNAIIEFARALLVAVATFFIAMAASTWRVGGTGPRIVGMVMFVLLPLLAGCTAVLWQRPKQTASATPVIDAKALPPSFWRMTSVVAVFGFAASLVQGYANATVPLEDATTQAQIVQLFQVFVAFAFIGLAVMIDDMRFNFGRVFMLIMVVSAFFIVLAPTAGLYAHAYYQTLPFAMRVFEFIYCCLLFFTAYQRRMSALLVVGYSYGAYLVSGALGWLVGTYMMPGIESTSQVLFVCIGLSFVTLAAAFMMFNEKEFDQLFEQQDEAQTPLSGLMQKRLESDAPVDLHRGRFVIAIDEIADRYELSRREKDVLRYLAMGYDATRIAETLTISWNTVRTHTRNLYGKLGVHSKQELVELVDRHKAP